MNPETLTDFQLKHPFRYRKLTREFIEAEAAYSDAASRVGLLGVTAVSDNQSARFADDPEELHAAAIRGENLASRRCTDYRVIGIESRPPVLPCLH